MRCLWRRSNCEIEFLFFAPYHEVPMLGLIIMIYRENAFFVCVHRCCHRCRRQNENYFTPTFSLSFLLFCATLKFQFSIQLPFLLPTHSLISASGLKKYKFIFFPLPPPPPPLTGNLCTHSSSSRSARVIYISRCGKMGFCCVHR